jgi:putative heme-binding domain-containing protein
MPSAGRAALVFSTLAACAPAVDPGIPAIGDPANRAAVVEAYRPALTLTPDIAHGKAIFDDTCAKCHRPRKDGIQVGPDLASIERRAPEELLESILNPSARIDEKFTNYIVRTKDNDVLDGLLAAETLAGITLRDNEGDHMISRGRISDFRKSKVSLMPEEIEKGLGRQSVADLIGYVRSLKR